MPHQDDDLRKMTAAASTLGWKKNEWPETFKTEDHQWTRQESTETKHGDILCVNYQDQHGDWLIVYND